WGLCFFNGSWVGADTIEARLDAMTLSILRFEDGRSFVDYTAPGGMAFFSGPWRKSNPEKTFAAHINTIPRPDVATKGEAESLYINNEGCMLFNNDYGNPPDPEEPQFENVGV